MLFEDDEKSPPVQLHPAFIALAVSIDSLVSVSFGMLQMNKFLFIVASCLFSLVFSYLALSYKRFLGINDGKVLRRFAGAMLLIMGIWSWLQ